MSLIGALTLVAAQTEAAPTAPSSSTGSYPAAFFASAKPNTAFDMIARLPGFTFDPGQSVRGFGGAGMDMGAPI